MTALTKRRHPSEGWDIMRQANALKLQDPSLRWGDGLYQEARA